MDSDINDNDSNEITFQINPYFDRLERLGLSLDELETAVSISLDAYFDLAEATEDLDSVPSIYDLGIKIKDKEYKLKDIAEIVLTR